MSPLFIKGQLPDDYGLTADERLTNGLYTIACCSVTLGNLDELFSASSLAGIFVVFLESSSKRFLLWFIFLFQD